MSDKIKKADLEQFRILYSMMDAVLNEFKELSKKKQDGVLNEIKVKMANRILSKIKSLLENDPTNEFLELLDDSKLPSNSDAVLIIAQFKAAMDQYRNRHTVYKNHSNVWNVEEDLEDTEEEDSDTF